LSTKNIHEIKSHWYSSIYEQNETQTEDIDCLLAVIGSQPRTILEVCCGGGRILVPLAKPGHHVHGFDIDADMLAYLPAKTQGICNLTWEQKDMLQDDWGGPYDTVVLAGNIMINIITPGDYAQAQRDMLRKARKALRNGGVIYLDFDCHAHPECIFNSQRERVIFEGTDDLGVYGKYIGCGGTYDPSTQIASGNNRTELTLPDGSQQIHYGTYSKHIPTLEQVHGWLKEIGFVIQEEYGDYARNPISEKTHKAIIIAKKG
jgi:SAM-dependent methyltransferase